MQQNILGFECFLAGKCRKIADLSHFFDEKFGQFFFFLLLWIKVYHRNIKYY